MSVAIDNPMIAQTRNACKPLAQPLHCLKKSDTVHGVASRSTQRIRMKNRFVAHAPTRIDFVGGWTDVQPFCDVERGLVVNAAFGVRARAGVCFDAPSQPTSDPFVRAACKRFGLENVTVSLESAAPVGSGLGGSGAVGVALVGALAAAAEKTLTRREIADLAHEIESQDLGVIGGKQDQYAAAYGGFLSLTFLGDEVQVSPFHLKPERVQEIHLHSVVVYTGQSRLSGDIHARVQEAYRAGNPDTLRALATIRKVAREFCSILPTGSIAALGELLNLNWEAQKRLHPSTTNAHVEHLFGIARNAGVYGGKALGAGGGGCLYLLSAERDNHRLVQALTAAGGRVLDAEFDAHGLTVNRLDEHGAGS